MVAELTIPGIDVSRDWLDGFFLPGQERFRHPNTADGHIALISKLQHLSGQVKVGFEATGGQEWGLWRELVAAGISAVQLPPAHTLSDASIACRAMDQGLRAISGHACEDRPDRSLPGRACLHA